MKEKHMKKEKHFYIRGSQTERPASRVSAYVDGTAGDNYRVGIDVELSHWLPNKTEDHYKAGTSTEICFRFLKANKTHPYDLVINNHLDIDGLLSVFVLCHPKIAFLYKDALCDAAKTGDFWAWSTGKALKLFQELTLLYQKLENQKTDLQIAYGICFDLVLKILESTEDKTDVQSLLKSQYFLIEQGKIKRQELCPIFVTYFVPQNLSKGRLQEFLQVPKFNEPLSERLAFWPQVRNCLDAEKIQLVAIESEQGIHYDLWYPGYVWADTHGLWKPAGLIPPKKTEDNHLMMCPRLSKIMLELNEIETGPCSWKLFSGMGLFDKKNPRKFPIVASTLGKENELKESHLSVDTVNQVFTKELKI
jgi:hypothetical protein